MMIRNNNRNISVAKGHGYTLDKVKFAKNFVEKSGRNTTIQDWVDAYNYIKDANETAQGCQACKAAKFTAAVRNYARYGYMTLLNEGYTPQDFEDKPVKVDEISKVDEAVDAESPTVTQAEAHPDIRQNVEGVVSEPSVELPIVDVQPEQDGIVDVESEEFTEIEQEEILEQEQDVIEADAESQVDAESQDVESVEEVVEKVTKPKKTRKSKNK